MGSILQSLAKTIHLSIVLAVLLFIYLFYAEGGWSFDLLINYFGVGYLGIFTFFLELCGLVYYGI